VNVPDTKSVTWAGAGAGAGARFVTSAGAREQAGSLAGALRPLDPWL